MDFEKTETGICNGQMVVLMLVLRVRSIPEQEDPCAL